VGSPFLAEGPENFLALARAKNLKKSSRGPRKFFDQGGDHLFFGWV